MELSESSGEETSFSSDDEELSRAYENKELKPGFYKLKVTEKKRFFANDVEGMKNKLKSFQMKKDWVERLDATSELAALAPELFLQSNKEEEDTLAHDDFKRELLFYRQAQATVMECIPRLHQFGIKTKRPEDYFAQMAKSDDHMKKVRETLLNKEAILERKEKARKLRELKKYGKQVQQEVLMKRQKEKQEILETLKRQKKKQNMDQDVFHKPKQNNMKPSALAKKKYKEQRFGYGGQKKRSKYNTAASSADVSDYYSTKSHSGKNKKAKPKPNKKAGKNFRPGKNRRMKMRNRKKR